MMYKLALRAVAGATCFISSLALAETPWATIPLFGSSLTLLACAVADGIIGEWRANRDMFERFQAEVDAQRLARQFRRTMDLFEWERRQNNG